ncbi:MAG TPA: rhodanese-like domain-containing protein [Gemmatimonadaceae bacterium]|nr:rhodanese-like domain-containing protein [Gemmatimonadaceae bacterium]
MTRPKTAADLIAEAKARIREVSPAAVMEMQQRGDPLVLLDVRDPNEVNLGMIPGALHLSRGRMETHIEALVPRDARLILYCSTGNRSAFAADTLQQMGYTNVASMAGGIQEWVERGGDVE